jgi:hypothetical protein
MLIDHGPAETAPIVAVPGSKAGLVAAAQAESASAVNTTNSKWVRRFMAILLSSRETLCLWRIASVEPICNLRRVLFLLPFCFLARCCEAGLQNILHLIENIP